MKYILILFAMPIILFLGSCYYTTQGYYLLNYSYSGKKINTLLKDSMLPNETRQLLQHVQEIRSFSKDTFSLNLGKSYTRYVELNRNYLLSVLQASPKTKIEAYHWPYPFVGRLPYRGFYILDDAKQEAKKLQKKGYDTYIRGVRAFSTLGVLPDPLYSFMKLYSEYDLAETLIHEQVHATIWLKKQSSFNEQLATFIGRKGAEEYITKKYGRNSDQYKERKIHEKESVIFRKLLLEIKDTLNAMYSDNNLTEEEKLSQKKEILKTFQDSFEKNYDSLFATDIYKNINFTKYNNAFFALISIYEENTSLFEDAYLRCMSISRFIQETKLLINNKKIKKAYKQRPYDYIKSICS